MPLTIELYGSDKKNTGHVMIDRKNLIFTYDAYGYASDEDDRFSDEDDRSRKESAFKNRNRIDDALDSTAYQEYFSSKPSFATTCDPRHDALEHMSPYDRNSFHVHLIFSDDIDFELVKLVFKHLSLEKISDLISEECKQNILAIAKGYFSELSHSANAQAIENEYREEKEREFERASEQAIENEYREEKEREFERANSQPVITPRHIMEYLLLRTIGLQLMNISFSLLDLLRLPSYIQELEEKSIQKNDLQFNSSSVLFSQKKELRMEIAMGKESVEGKKEEQNNPPRKANSKF